MRKKAGQGIQEGIVELCLSSAPHGSRKLNVIMDRKGKFSIMDIPSWLQESDMCDLLEMYKNDGNLPELLAAVLQAESLEQEASDT